MVDGEGGSSERCLKWGGGEWGVIKGSYKSIVSLKCVADRYWLLCCCGRCIKIEPSPGPVDP